MKTLFVLILSTLITNVYSQELNIDTTIFHKYSYKQYNLYWNDSLAISKNTKTEKIDTIFMKIFEEYYIGKLNEKDSIVYEGDIFHYEENYSLLSIVGPFISFNFGYMEYSGGIAHPSYGARTKTYNLETGKPFLLTDIFGKEIIFKELLKQKIILKSIAKEVSNLDELLSELESYCVPLGELLSSVSFGDVVDSTVTVNFSIMHCNEAARGMVTEFQINLSIPKEFYPLFKIAKEENTLYGFP